MNPQALKRYSRHILLTEIGEQGQEKISASSVLMIGAGGLGCPVLQYLAAAGVGKIGIIDDDRVDESNLQRQVLYGVSDVGTYKVVAAQKRLQDLNPLISIDIYPERLTTDNALELFEGYDVIVDGTDNFATRYLVNDACVLAEKPLVYGSIYKFEGQVAVFNYQAGPSYRCLFPEPPAPGSVPSCSQIGVLGVLPGLIGTHQANETLKIILGIGEVLSGKLLVLNAMDSSSVVLNVQRNQQQVDRVLNQRDQFLTTNYDQFCNGSNDDIEEITVDQLMERMATEQLQLIDVREPSEQPKLDQPNVLNYPLGELSQHAHKIDRNKPTVVFCQRGGRSIKAIKELKKEYGFNNLVSLAGGIEALKNSEHEYDN